MTRALPLINKVIASESLDYFRRIEILGDLFLSFLRLLFARTYYVDSHAKISQLKSHEDLSLQKRIGQVTAFFLLPVSCLAALLGALLKQFAFIASPNLKKKYALPLLVVNARTEENFSGILLKNPLTPNCVNSQQLSLFGKNYNVLPIRVPKTLADDEVLNRIDSLILASNGFIAKKTEQRACYRHYEFRVDIPVLGRFIDDLDLWYDIKRRVIDVRSASRSGFRDALSFNFSIWGANKKLVEKLRELFRGPKE